MSDIYQQFLKQRKEPITEESYPAWLQNKVEDLQAENERLKEANKGLEDYITNLQKELGIERSFEDGLISVLTRWRSELVEDGKQAREKLHKKEPEPTELDGAKLRIAILETELKEAQLHFLKSEERALLIVKQNERLKEREGEIKRTLSRTEYTKNQKLAEIKDYLDD